MSKKAGFFQHKGSSHINSLELFREAQCKTLPMNSYTHFWGMTPFISTNQNTTFPILTLLLLSSAFIPVSGQASQEKEASKEKPDFTDCKPDFKNVGFAAALGAVGGAPHGSVGGVAGVALSAAAGGVTAGVSTLAYETSKAIDCMEKKLPTSPPTPSPKPVFTSPPYPPILTSPPPRPDFNSPPPTPVITMPPKPISTPSPGR